MKSKYSQEEFALFNPPFIGYLIYSSIREFTKSGNGMHCSLPFLIIPIALNEAISSKLPMSSKTKLGTWVGLNEGILSILYDQAESYYEIVKIAIIFLFKKKLIYIDIDNGLIIKDNSLVIEPALFKKSNQMKNALKISKFLGKWFSHSSSIDTVFIQLGIRP